MQRRIVFVLFGPALLCFVAAAFGGEGELPTLTKVAQIRALSIEEAGRGYPVRVRAVVTFHNSYRYCFAQDETGPIYVMRQYERSPGALSAGDLVDFEGVTEPGLYAPEILEARATIVGHAELPPPRPVEFADLQAKKYHCERVSVEGIVRAVDNRWFGGSRLDLQIETDGGQLDTHVYDVPKGRSYDDLLDAKIRLVGLASGKFNARREFVRPTIDATGLESITVEEKGEADPYSNPREEIGNLLRFSNGEPGGRRICVKGTVTYQQAGDSLYIRDETGGLLVKSQSAMLLDQGDEVEAAGLPIMGVSSPVLQHAIFRKAGHVPARRPRAVTAEEALSGKCDADLVQIEAELVNSMIRKDERVLILKADGVIFEGRLRGPVRSIHDPNSTHTLELPVKASAPEPPWPVQGSTLLVTGICSVPEILEAGMVLMPRSFQILLRAPQDIAVLKGPPWWTPKRMAWIFGAMGLTILGSIAWAALLRMRVRQQTEIIRQRVHDEAVMQERHRMAREIHDTLVQGFAGISLQLEAVRDKLPPESPVLRRHLEVAHSLARESMAEARRSIWAWHNDSLLTARLPAALAASVKSIAGDTETVTNFDAKGDFSRVSADLENNLLYIGREAILNAVKYAAAKAVTIELSCENSHCCLVVKDDGKGFDASKMQANGVSSSGGFGLISMRERAQQIGAQIEIDSELGRGTTIAVTAPCQPINYES